MLSAKVDQQRQKSECDACWYLMLLAGFCLGCWLFCWWLTTGASEDAGIDDGIASSTDYRNVGSPAHGDAAGID